MQHTPPDWLVNVDSTPNRIISIVREFKKGFKTHSRHICTISVHGFHEENEANARLIAAAPKLFAMVKEYDQQGVCGNTETDDCKPGKCWACDAKRLVNKIEKL